MQNNRLTFMERLSERLTSVEAILKKLDPIESLLERIGKSSVSCPLKPSDSAPLKHSTMPP